RAAARETFPATARSSTRFAFGGLLPTAQHILVPSFGPGSGSCRVGGSGAFACGDARLCQCLADGSALGALHVVRPCGPGLVRVRLGNSTARNGVPGHLSVPVAGWPAFFQAATPGSHHLAFSLVDLPHHARRRADQNPRRLLLARFDLPLLPL